MEISRQMAQISVLVTSFLCVGAWECKTRNCLVYPLSLKLWNNQIEVSARSLRVSVGSDFSVTCDGSCVGSQADPHLRWYGPDRHWIAYEGGHNRLHIEKSFSRRYLKLHIRKVSVSDQGDYLCRGWLGTGRGWDTKSIRLIVDTSDATTTHSDDLEQTSQPATSTTPTGTPTVTPTVASTIANLVHEETTSAEPTCLPPKFRCGSGECFDPQYVCDSFPDCSDASDENNCASLICTEDQIACTDGNGCVPSSHLCDGIRHCADASDENPDVCNYK